VCVCVCVRARAPNVQMWCCTVDGKIMCRIFVNFCDILYIASRTAEARATHSAIFFSRQSPASDADKKKNRSFV
jgi:hypothetical protein